MERKKFLYTILLRFHQQNFFPCWTNFSGADAVAAAGRGFFVSSAVAKLEASYSAGVGLSFWFDQFIGCPTHFQEKNFESFSFCCLIRNFSRFCMGTSSAWCMYLYWGVLVLHNFILLFYLLLHLLFQNYDLHPHQTWFQNCEKLYLFSRKIILKDFRVFLISGFFTWQNLDFLVRRKVKN